MADVIITIPDDLNAAIELLIDNNVEFIKPYLLRQVLYVISGKIPGPSSGGFSATAPLSYNPFTNSFTITKASSTTDGFLSKEDFNTFNNGGSVFLLNGKKASLFKNPENDDPAKENELEENDVVNGIVENSVIFGIYNGGSTNMLGNYTVYTSIEF